ncbi:MAG TPA: AMP-binding protein, partial [Kofleriaceae bacterium]|nr:AMP-binding protein [Kofleriaceae bacterium]
CTAPPVKLPMSAIEPLLIDDAALDAGAAAMARFLTERGCRAGDRVALLAGNTPLHLQARLAAAALDLVLVPINPRLAAPEIAWIAAHCRPRLLLADRELMGAAPGALPLDDARSTSGFGPDLDPTHLGPTLLYTSGTTGRPKGCMRTAAQEDARSRELALTYELGADDVHIIASPLAHSGPGIFSRAARAAGARTVLLPRFTPTGFLAAVAATRATIVFMVPTQCERLLALPAAARAAHDTSSLRAVIVAGAPFAPATKQRMVAWLGPGVLWEYYGSSETGTVTVLPPGEQLSRPGSVGRAPPFVSLRLLDAERRPVAAGELGEVYAASESLMAGYLDDRGEPAALDTADGHFSVGDLGRLDADGYLTLVDRKHDTIISGGVNVYPAEVERALAEHPRVLGAVAFGLPDADWGQIVAAAVALADAGEPRAEAAALRDFLRQRIAAYKVPKAIAVLDRDDLPIGSSGKRLRRQAAATLAGSPHLIRF